MTVKELVAWAFKAQEVREDSWNLKTIRYDVSQEQALEKCRPPDATDHEMEIASRLNDWGWNEVQCWNKVMNP